MSRLDRPLSDEEQPLWRSLEELEARALPEAEHGPEPSRGPEDLALPPLGRRRFMELVGAGAGLAGIGLGGCLRKPQEPILPYAQRPEDLVPGRPRFFATSACIGGSVLGLLVESQDGRPTKIEGNPLHPMSLGAASAWAQAEVLTLYDPDRSRRPRHLGKDSSFAAFDSFARSHFDGLARSGGRGLALVLPHLPSPTLLDAVERLRTRFPESRLVLHDHAGDERAAAAAALLGVPYRRPLLAIDRADLLVALDSDWLGSEGDAVRNARLFATRRQPGRGGTSLNRLYAVEPAFTVTGGMADHRLRLPSSQIAGFLQSLISELLDLGLVLPVGAERLASALKDPASRPLSERDGPFLKALARDLIAHRGRSLILVGERQPPVVQALGLLLGAALGALPDLMVFARQPRLPSSMSLARLAEDMERGRVTTLVLIRVNPAFDAPADLRFGERMQRVPTRIHHGLHIDETASLCGWHLPATHFLEAWGDHIATDGTASVQQPLIAPLFDSRSELELLALLMGSGSTRGYELVRAAWQRRLGAGPGFEPGWRRVLHDGLDEKRAEFEEPVFDWGRIPQALAALVKATSQAQAPELSLHLDPRVLDGRYANNGWLQELPEPASKLTWGNAAILSPATARARSLENGDPVRLTTAAGRSLELPVFVVPGTADDTVVVHLGHGRRSGGQVLRGVGADAFQLCSTASPFFEAGLRIEPLGGPRRRLASTQDHGRQEGRPLIRRGTALQFRQDPTFARKMQAHPELRSIFVEPNERAGHQWGMSIDLGACTGCNACVVACVAENNIPVVGEERVVMGREMHWLRIDRYFEGPPDDPSAMLVQPMACHHCELAPCEGVCPVAATVHSPDGLNDMAYNRCVGTRYCSNNCPYKVRRYNFFQYNGDIDVISQMQKNPDVTIRFRGVMEKCTYCVQRISEAKIKAKRDGNGVVPDGAVIPACAQTCPTHAIVFGNLNDPASEVSRRKRDPRDYVLLAELNNKPRTSYLARLRNPNPELEKP